MTPAEHVTVFLLRIIAAAIRVAPSLTGKRNAAWYYLAVEARQIEGDLCSS